jgi:hypothetical protein
MKYACAMQSDTPQYLTEMISCGTLHIIGQAGAASEAA